MYDIDYDELEADLANDELIAALWQEEFEEESKIADSYPHDERWKQGNPTPVYKGVRINGK